MPYQVINVELDEPASDTIYDTAQEAVMARGMYSFKTRIQAVVDPNDSSWMERERIRLEDGTYTPVPSWFELYCNPDHFVHLAQGTTLSDGMLAFTENAQKGQQDLQLKLSVSRYLARFHGDNLSSDRIRDIAGKFAADTYTLTIEQTKEAFIFAYEGQEVCSESSTYVSCMAKQTSDYGTPVHPAAVYYTGSRSDSLAIAYIRNPKNDNKILARAVVWPDRQTFVKLYGTSEDMRIVLREKLEAAGFTRDDDFSGARLRRIEVNGARFVMPYIDGDCQCVDDHGDHFEITGSGDYTATETRGYIYSNSRYTCDNCGDGMDEDDARDVQGDTWCEHCYDNHTFFCERAEETYPESYGSNEVVTTVQRRYSDPTRREMTQTWSQDACDGEAFFCEHTETYYDSRYFTSVDVTVRTPRGAIITETWCAEKTREDYFTCPDCGEAYTHDFMSTTHNDDGELVCTDCAEKINTDDEYKFKLPPTTPTINDHNQHVIDFHAACVAA